MKKYSSPMVGHTDRWVGCQCHTYEGGRARRRINKCALPLTAECICVDA